MEMKTPVIAVLLFFSLLFLGSVTADGDGDGDGGTSIPASSSPAAPCSAKLSVNTRLIPFNTSSLSCYTAWSSRDFVLMYKQQGPSLWSFVLSAPDTKGYIAVGFSSNGKMVGSSAVAGWISASGGPGVVNRYYLGGKSPGLCPPDQGSLQLVGSPLILSQSSRLYLAFQLNTSQPQSRLLYALGPQGRLPGSDYLLPEHRDMVSTSVNYATGQGETDGGSSTLKKTHGALGLAGWGVLMPIGILVARYSKRWDPLWFYTHISVQGLGFGLGLAGIITGFSLEEKVDEDVDTHKAIGILILVLGCLQVMALLARPDKTSKVRKYWNWYHHYVGRAAVAFAIANIFYGLSLADEESSWSIGYGVYLGAWFLICLVLEVRMCISK